MLGAKRPEPTEGQPPTFEELKQSLHTLTVDEAAQRFEEMAVHRLAKAPPRQQKIDQRRVAVHGRVHQRGDARVVGSIDVNALL